MIKPELLFSYLDEKYPNAHCELVYSKDYEFLIAVMLSAQCTDERVNRTTPLLFAKFYTFCNHFCIILRYAGVIKRYENDKNTESS